MVASRKPQVASRKLYACFSACVKGMLDDISGLMVKT